MRTNTSLTLYTKTIANKAEVWTRSVINHVQWENAHIARVSRSGVIEADQIMVFIPFSEGEITIKPGDYIVRGTVSDVVGDDVGETTIAAIRATYAPYCGVVREVNRLDIGSFEMNHWEVGAN